MFSRFEIETHAEFRREEIARQVAAMSQADLAMRNSETAWAWLRHLATALRTLATWLAPTTAETTVDAEPLVT